MLELVDEYYHDEIFDPKPFDDPTSAPHGLRPYLIFSSGSDAGPMFVDDEGYPLIFKPSSPALLDDEEVRLPSTTKHYAHRARIRRSGTSGHAPCRTPCGQRT